MKRKRHIAAENMYLLKQSLQLLETIDPKVYSGVAAPKGFGCIGDLFRSCLNAYACFLKGNETGNIDYNAHLAPVGLASDVADALAQTRRTMEELEAFPDEAYFTVHVKTRAADSSEDQGFSRSSVLRELQFLANHTAQHLALIAMALRFHGVDTISFAGGAIRDCG